ncbi:TetR/AcrR family transcriptional regulator [Arthrobacter cryoconiti]|uniref:TetR/AcrR family transcriptional regulator n=1 Tax=Arthrobacter cryoconiti TaxID=748907 RepID=A0ABV8R2G9_9MICC|nr:TetR/AcrR family transcriptional regulator [Arthrobacter cryoconiti]MCC9068124.1 TetR/AcrR family transcriptional regulator [Arthrobacter cryoconiti]
MNTPSSPSGIARPGGRTARTAGAAHNAVLALIAERGREGLTMREISDRSGLHEATLYRRWRNVDTLVLDAATQQISRDSPIPDTGSLRGDLRAWAESTAAQIVLPGGFSLFEALSRSDVTGSGGDEDTILRREQARGYLKQRSAQLDQAFERARIRGENVPEASDVLDRILAPLYLRVVFGYRRADEGLDALIDGAMR